jgi:hypothetical protein
MRSGREGRNNILELAAKFKLREVRGGERRESSIHSSRSVNLQF